jgi:hypothetical protein
MNLLKHLSEDDLDEILMGIASPDASAHLAECPPCAERLTAFESQLAVFNHASLAWSEARSNTLTRDISAHKATPRVTLTTVWGSAATLMVALAFGLSITLHPAPATLEAANPSSSQPAIAVHPEHDQNELASDNAMLEAIDSEMGAPQPVQFEVNRNTRTSSTATPRLIR